MNKTLTLLFALSASFWLYSDDFRLSIECVGTRLMFFRFVIAEDARPVHKDSRGTAAGSLCHALGVMDVATRPNQDQQVHPQVELRVTEPPSRHTAVPGAGKAAGRSSTQQQQQQQQQMTL